LSVSEWYRHLKEGREDVQDDPRSGQPKTWRTDENVYSVRMNGDTTVLFGSADKVMGIYLDEKTQTMARQVDSPP
jgi:hypothetical protein